MSFLQQIGYKDINIDGTIYRLFVFGVRDSSYEEEWAVNMRIGAEGDAVGFQEARDGVLGFGTRAQYLQDLEELALLETEETPTHYTEAYESESNTPSDELEAKLEAKYTKHLYAQWEDASTKPTPKSGPSKAPSTGDAMMFGILAMVATAALASLLIARRKRRNTRF